MQESTNLKRAKIIPFTEEEQAELRKKAAKYLKENNDEELSKLYDTFPYSAWVLQSTKEFWGIDHVLDNGYNVYNAVKKYGVQWVEK